LSSPSFSLQPPSSPLQHHCYHCGNDWWPRTFTRPQRCPRCQCKFWNIPHYQGLHPRRQGNLRLPTPPPQPPPTTMLQDQAAAGVAALAEAEKGEPLEPK